MILRSQCRPQAQFIDETMAITVVQQIKQRQMSAIQKIQKTVKILQVQFGDEVADVAVVIQGRCLWFRVAEDREDPTCPAN